ncbi:peptide N-acetyl-beta-D-glucosaminyl asparaginase amidase A-domain-containing protein [Epithele typhae]|uniref:peptide N-acetyl-beta-D-glucosaminyl asparaginase amidase A-domain-containing protein n=1 Tax=Epithele typhae TaxID=378194 RepID=UPI0020074CA3|nr:peptide N-acetyl-beta-D-glucosaminyl asparaginase amidase A-domain-containing protein [Epithele typhae]KAH9944490.1 peptide N-acetyl-beta-D-glucosaminyl asparaginase amidase A-domain-containing protein [Epithele typhae]
MTNDDTVAPLVDMQLYAPPVVPLGGTNCEVQLLRHDFGDGSYNNPAVVSYTPPKSRDCGEAGQWAVITLNMTVYSNGTQYDRLSSLYLSHVEIWRHSSAEPTKTGTIWTVKDVTHYSALFAEPGNLLMDFSNIISADLLLDGVFHVTLTGTFYAPTRAFPKPTVADLVLPISNLSPNQSNFFTVADNLGGTASVTVPRTTQQAILEALVDGQLSGVVWPHAVIYTGGITPTNWRPITAFGAYDQPTYFIDVTPFLPLLADGAPHNITLRVLGQGEDPTINSNWFVSGSLHVWVGKKNVSGTMTRYEIDDAPASRTSGRASADNATVYTSVVANRTVLIESVLYRDKGRQVVRFEQHLAYSNDQKYEDDGWVQWGTQLTEGTTLSTHGSSVVLRDAFSYPLSVFSNYSQYELEYGGYGSAINQTYARALRTPAFAHASRTTLSVQHARGTVGMDAWPGLRHAINGTGATAQRLAFAAGSGEAYFRASAAADDAWTRDAVWGTPELVAAAPRVPEAQIKPGGGPGFRRDLAVGAVLGHAPRVGGRRGV